MCTKDYENEFHEEEKYKSFLQIIAIISFLTILFEGGRFVIYLGQLDYIQKTLALMSIVLLFLILVMGLILANGFVLHIENFDKVIAKFRSHNDRAVTFLFFCFLLSTVLFIIQDGGAKNSGITNILVLCANFGFFFAQKKRIRYIALISCLVGYLICNIVGYTVNNGFYFSKPDFSAVITTVMSIVFNLIITSNVTWFIQNNSDDGNQSMIG